MFGNQQLPYTDNASTPLPIPSHQNQKWTQNEDVLYISPSIWHYRVIHAAMTVFIFLVYVFAPAKVLYSSPPIAYDKITEELFGSTNRIFIYLALCVLGTIFSMRSAWGKAPYFSHSYSYFILYPDHIVFQPQKRNITFAELEYVETIYPRTSKSPLRSFASFVFKNGETHTFPLATDFGKLATQYDNQLGSKLRRLGFVPQFIDTGKASVRRTHYMFGPYPK